MLSENETEAEGVTVSRRLFVFLILGITLVLIGIVVLAVVSLVLGSLGSVGVVIFIGPFPIVFGSGPNAILLILVGIILAVLMVLFWVMRRRFDWFKI